MRLALALTLLPLPALAAIQPCHLDAMVAEAPVAVQVVAPEVEGPDAAGTCALSAEVAQSFRGPLAPGERLTATFPCANPQGIAGPATYHAHREVARAATVELHLDADGSVAGHGWGLMVLEGVTEEMAFPFEFLGEDGACA